MSSKYVVVIFAGAWLLMQSAFAESVKVAVGDWPPYLSSELRHNGVVAHLISDIFLEEGLDAEITFFPWPRAYKDAAHGRQDSTGVWMYKPEREDDFLYSDPVLQEQFVFFHLKTFPFHWEQLSDLENLLIGGGLKYSYGADFDAAIERGELKVERVLTEVQNFEKLFRKRIQIYPQELNVGYSVLKENFSAAIVQTVTHHPKPFLNNLSYLLFPKKSERSVALLKKFNRRLKMFRESGQYDEYFEAFQRGEYQE